MLDTRQPTETRHPADFADCVHCHDALAVHRHGPGEWVVPSRSVPAIVYRVSLWSDNSYSCECRWGRSTATRGKCFHVKAALLAAHARHYPALALELSGLLSLLQVSLARYWDAQAAEEFPDVQQDLAALCNRLHDRLDEMTRPPKASPVRAGEAA